MNAAPVELVLAKLASARQTGDGQWLARCPGHDDRRASLSVGVGNNGTVLLRCHAGCEIQKIVAAIGLKLADLMPDQARPLRAKEPPKRQLETFPTAREAVASLESRHGPRSASWTYTDADGKPLGVIVRWDLLDGGKDILPVSRNGPGWAQCGMPVPRPLYRLSELSDAKRILVCEGEKVVETARAIGMVATTSAHGSSSATKTDWSPLAGKECIVLPDADKSGRKYAASVAHLLYALNPRPTIKIVELPDLSEGSDLVNWLDAGHTQKELLELVERTPEWKPSPAESSDNNSATVAKTKSSTDKTPSATQKQNRPQVPEFQPFPVSVLPEPACSFVLNASAAMGVDPSFIALPLLVGLASAIGNTHRLQLKLGWTEPGIIWGAVIAESGCLKSPAMELALRPIRRKQAQALEEYADEMEKYGQELETYKADLQDWKREGRRSGDPQPLEPAKPIAGRYICSDVTVESLASLLHESPRGILCARDELSGWLRSFDQYKGGRGGDVSLWLELHRAGFLLVDRKTGDSRTTAVPHAAVSVVGGIQPAILQRSLGAEHVDDGLLARLLVALPPRRAKKWNETEIDPRFEKRVAAVYAYLFDLEAGVDPAGELRPVLIRMDATAKELWVSFYNAHAEEQTELTGELAAAWSKIEAYVARFALLFHLIRCATGEVRLGQDLLDEHSMGAAIRLGRWFAQEARRVYSVLAESPGDAERRQLCEFIARKGGSVTVRDVQRSSRAYHTAEDAELALKELEQADLGRWEHPAPGAAGGHPETRFFLNEGPPVDTTPTGATENGGCVSVDGVSARKNAPDEWGEI